MNTQNVIYKLRTNLGLSQDDLAERVFVTRQAVSRWENGETVPNTETDPQRALLPVVLCGRDLHVQQYGRPDRRLRGAHGR